MTFKAIGRYSIDATREEKVYALTDTVEAATVELAELGVPLEEIEEMLEKALAAAEWCHEELADA